MRIIPDSNNGRVFIQIRNLTEITERSIRHGFFQMGKDLRKTASDEILRRPKSGRVYVIRTRSGRRRRHVASAPGETHANLSGTLRRSIGWHVTGHRRLEWGYGVDKPAPEYGRAIEHGSSRIQPRPSLRNAMNAIERNATNYFNQSFNDELRR